MPVYLIRAGESGPVKIGFTAGLMRVRLTKMQTDNHERLSVIRWLQGDEETEAKLHRQYAALRIRGDWFEFCATMLNDLGIPDEPVPVRDGPCSRSPFALGRYLADENISIPTFAAGIGVSVQAVHRYVGGERAPHREIMGRIIAITGGMVKPNDFHDAVSSRTARKSEAA